MKRFAFLGALAATALTASMVDAQDRLANVEIRTEQVGEGLYVLFGAGGNIGLSVGPDGAFLVDDQFAPLTDKILAAIAEVTDQPVRFVINTHYHGDHTGGNENLGRAGALIIAHDNIRVRMSADAFLESNSWQTSGEGGYHLPVVTFNDQVSLHINGMDIRAVHVVNAHTDGDSIIVFNGANVIHTGDTFFNPYFPFVDVDSGGNIDGYLAAIDLVLEMANEETVIIPGHGEVSNRSELSDYRAFLGAQRDEIAGMIESGDSLETILENASANQYNDTYGSFFITAPQFITAVYRSLTGE